MSDRPKFCEEVNCQYYAYKCRLDQEIVRGWERPISRKKPRQVLLEEVRQNPQEVINRCAQTLS